MPPTSLSDRGNDPLYESFYGLREQPFSLTTDPRFLYLSADHRFAFDELLTGLRRREGLLILTGDTGTGKTTLCRAVIDALGHRSFSALILNPYMSDIEVLRTIVRDFGLVSREEIRTGAFNNADIPQLLDTLETFLRSLVSLNSYAVVIIDEAQSLEPRVLDQIRVLGSLEQDGRRLLQIVLVGQPALLETLRSDAMRALADRVSRRITLSPLPLSDIDAYVRHRLAIAGGKGAVVFEPAAVARVAELSSGLPRRINLLCDRALEIGRASDTKVITGSIITKAAQAISGASYAAVTDPPPPVTTAPSVTPKDQDDPAWLDLPPLEAVDTTPAPKEARRFEAVEPQGIDLLDRLDEATSTNAPLDEEERARLYDMPPPAPEASSRNWMLVIVLGLALGAAAYAIVRMGWLSF